MKDIVGGKEEQEDNGCSFLKVLKEDELYSKAKRKSQHWGLTYLKESSNFSTSLLIIMTVDKQLVLYCHWLLINSFQNYKYTVHNELLRKTNKETDDVGFCPMGHVC